MPDPLAPAALDARFARFREVRRVPGLAWGIIRDGRLEHSGGCGTSVDGEDRPPDADTVFRIASMTKSFTAATVLLLSDDGRLRLDDPVGEHVPELAAWAAPAADSPPVTLRRLLSMAAGLPTDDPWGDRQQGLPLDRFAELLAAGPVFAWPPGTTFEYSNLGYGILGRAVTRVAGEEYGDVVRKRLLAPMGMTASTFDEGAVDPDRLAHGYARLDDRLVREGRDPYGALASMGGLWTSVRDLAVWVSGFLDAFPARSDPEGPHPLRRSSRREMQQVQRSLPAFMPAHAPDAPPAVVAGGYGFGLMIRHDPDLGTFVGHSGGYPGYGSNMTWHPATGLGVVVLTNLRYGRPSDIATEVLADLVRDDAAPRRRPRPLPAVEAHRATVEHLLAGWDEAVADGAFAMNLDLDLPRAHRRAAIEAAVAAIGGPFHPDAARPATSESAADVTWWLRGARGWLRLRILVSPEPSPRIQALDVTAVGDPSPALVAAAGRLLAADRDSGAQPGPAVDVARLERSRSAALARFGALRLGRPVGGDGRRETTWAVIAEDGGSLTLRLALDPDTGAVSDVELLVAAREAPAEAW